MLEVSGIDLTPAAINQIQPIRRHMVKARYKLFTVEERMEWVKYLEMIRSSHVACRRALPDISRGGLIEE